MAKCRMCNRRALVQENWTNAPPLAESSVLDFLNPQWVPEFQFFCHFHLTAIVKLVCLKRLGAVRRQKCKPFGRKRSRLIEEASFENTPLNSEEFLQAFGRYVVSLADRISQGHRQIYCESKNLDGRDCTNYASTECNGLAVCHKHKNGVNALASVTKCKVMEVLQRELLK